MIQYHPYPKYKDSEIAWLDEIPEDWTVKASKFGFEIQLGKMLQNEPKKESDVFIPYLKALHVLWNHVKVSELPNMWASSYDIVKYGVKNGDLLVCEGGEVGRAAILTSLDSPAIIQNALHRVRSNNENVCAYLAYLLEVVAIRDYFDVLCNKATIAHFTGEKFGSLRIPFPGVLEQNHIVSFLDRETAHIDALIGRKQRFTELLKEKRQAIITQAVTKGLVPNVPMKDSGVEWLGEVPEYWEVPKISHVAILRSGEGITSGDIEEEGSYPVYGGNGLRGYTSSYTHDGYYTLIGRQGALCGNINYARGRFWASEHAIVVSSLRAFDPVWMGELLSTMNLNQYSVSAAQPGLSVETIKALQIPFPPFKEQRTIATHIRQKTEAIDNVIEKTEKSIHLLSERRSALITAAVTGQIDVRGGVA